MVKKVSITNGIPTICLSLLFVICISMLKDLLEDLKRWKSDREENNSETRIFKNGKFENTYWKDIYVGNIIKIQQDEKIPADVILLETDRDNGKCFVETKNLDGETNLKEKKV